MKNIITGVLVLLSVSIFSQERRELKDGKEYIIHSVKQGETIYGISQKYNVTKKELRNSNSGLLLFISPDQELYVPIPDEDRTIHVVKKGETLYGIAKQYGLEPKDLVLLNPEKAISLKPGHLLILKSESETPVYEKAKIENNNPVIEETAEPVSETKKVEGFVLGDGDVHTVVAGETLYAIARKYNLSVSELMALNSHITGNTISIGDKLNIPSQNKPTQAESLIKQVEYKVEKGETLYGISKKFNTTVAEISALNPSVTSLKEGDVLKINVPEKGTEQIKIDLGSAKATDSLDTDKVNVVNPLKDKLNAMVMKETYNVSMFLPFMLDKNDQTPVEVNKPKKINPMTEMSTHFYQGAILALDSAKSSGVSIDLNVYDSEKDTNTVGKLLRTEKVKTSDLIIGPFYEKPYNQVADFSKKNGIQTVSPVSQSNRMLFDNMYITQLQTSLPTQLIVLAEYIAENRNTENVISVSGKTKKEKYLFSMFNEKYNELIANKTNNYRSKAGEYSMISFSSMNGFDAKLVKGKKNIIVLPFTEEGMATSFFTQLNILMTRSRMKGYEIEIYALENFIEFDNINVDFKMKYNLHVSSSSYIDYKSEAVKSFVRNYRARYGTEPNKYAFVGYDVAFYHALALNSFGKNFASYYDQIQVPLLQSSYNLKRTDVASGFENQSVFILQYKDYELVKVN